MLTEVILIGLLIGCYYYWSTSLQAREIALNATIQYCRKQDLQLLDHCVALHGFWFKRDSAGRLSAWRSYTFEFSSTGDERYNGKIILLGGQVLSIQTDPYRINHYTHDEQG